MGWGILAVPFCMTFYCKVNAIAYILNRDTILSIFSAMSASWLVNSDIPATVFENNTFMTNVKTKRALFVFFNTILRRFHQVIVND